tara:strand:+ start:3149 stop:3385 length:237 start_codon:yes stop_codon:yes gene_type:complete
MAKKKETKPDLNMLPEEEHIHKRLHDINTMYCNDGELTLYGRDEYGKEFTLNMCLYEAINWFDKEYFKKKLIKHIKEL